MSKTKDNRDLKSSLDFNKSRADRFATKIAKGLGSITFLISCILFFIGWAVWNLRLIPGLKAIDPFPFPILDMSVSLFAVILSVSVLINQNRQGKIDKLQQQIEFEVNVRAESEVTKILNMLHEIHRHLGLEDKKDKELEEMKEATDIQKIHEKLNEE